MLRYMAFLLFPLFIYMIVMFALWKDGTLERRRLRKAELMEGRRRSQRESAYAQERRALEEFYHNKRVRWANLRLEWEMKAESKEQRTQDEDLTPYLITGSDRQIILALAEACPECEVRPATTHGAKHHTHLCSRCGNLPVVKAIHARSQRLT